MTLQLTPPLGIAAPIKTLECLWLEASCYYYLLDDNCMSDHAWNDLGKELWERRSEVSPYFTHALGRPWPFAPSPGDAEDYNPLHTAMEINWEEGLPALVVEGIRKEGPKRLREWKLKIEALVSLRQRQKAIRAAVEGPGNRLDGKPRRP